jgi:putative DNA primase/helicase
MNDKHAASRDIASTRKPHSVGPMHQLTALAGAQWASAQPVEGTPAQTYLRSQGIDFCPAELRYMSACPIGSGPELRCYPAMLAALRDDDGLVAIEQTILSPDGRLADIARPKRIVGFPVGGLGRWGMTPHRILRLADSAEEAASAMILGSLGIPIWPVFGCARYELIDIPASIRRIIIYARHDGEVAAAIVRATAHLTAHGRSLEIEYAADDASWNTYLRRVRSCS